MLFKGALHTVRGHGWGGRAAAQALLIPSSGCLNPRRPRVVDVDLPREPQPTLVLPCAGGGRRKVVVHPRALAESAFKRLVDACPSDVRGELWRMGPYRLLLARTLVCCARQTPGARMVRLSLETFCIGDARSW